MTTGTAWVYLVLAGVLDVAWAVAMKKSGGFANPGWATISFVLLIAFVYLLTRALTVLPLGSAYAVWTGIGAGGTVLLGIVMFGESLSTLRLLGVLLVIAGIVALKLDLV